MSEIVFLFAFFGSGAIAMVGILAVVTGCTGEYGKDSGMIVLLGIILIMFGASVIFTLTSMTDALSECSNKKVVPAEAGK